MSFKLKCVLIMLLGSIPFSLINFSAFLKGYTPTIFQALTSILFLVLLLLYGLIMGMNNKGELIQLSTLYWGFAALVSLIGYTLDNLLLFVPVALFFVGPIYGIRYFVEIPPNSLLVYISILVAYGLGLLGYLLGRGMRKKEDLK